MKGMYWKRGAASRAMLRGGKEPDRIVMNNCAILLSDLEIEQPADLLPLINLLMRAGNKALLLVGEKFSESVISFILANKKPEKFRIIAVKTPGNTAEQRHAHLSDMAVITGAQPLFKAAGDTLSSALSPPKSLRRKSDTSSRHSRQDTYFGQVKQVWVERTMFGLVSDREDQGELTEHLADLLELAEYATDKDSEAFLRERIGKILGGAAILRIGDAVPARMDSRIALAKETAKSLRRALRDGVMPGAGVALLACRAQLKQAIHPAADSDARAAQGILRQALAAPIQAICHNAGFDSAKVAELDGKAPGCGVDVRSGDIVDVMAAGIIDVASVTEGAIRSAVTSAALALTIDVLLHHAQPAESYTP